MISYDLTWLVVSEISIFLFGLRPQMILVVSLILTCKMHMYKTNTFFILHSVNACYCREKGGF